MRGSAAPCHLQRPGRPRGPAAAAHPGHPCRWESRASPSAQAMVAKQRIRMANEKHSKNITQRGNVAKTLVRRGRRRSGPSWQDRRGGAGRGGRASGSMPGLPAPPPGSRSLGDPTGLWGFLLLCFLMGREGSGWWSLPRKKMAHRPWKRLKAAS